MKRTASLPRRSLLVGAALLTGVLAMPTPAHAYAVVHFSAQSADACPHGLTEGTLSWAIDQTWHSAVGVAGTLVDEPSPATSGSFACADDGYDSDASFTLYSGTSEQNQTVVASAHEQVDNAQVSFAFTLRGDTDVRSGIAASERLVVQICRSPANSQIKAPTYCGKPVTYYPAYTLG
jgi:hypothetical protein